MAGASYVVSSFLGGEISQFAQGRFDKPDYKTSLNVCLNSFPTEIGAWVRRPGSRFAGTTRGGAPGRVIKFDFEQAIPYTLEFTDGFLRFRNGVTLITNNDAQVVLAVSSANPAVVQTTSATIWNTGDTLIFPGKSTPLLEARQFVATKVDTTHFSLADAITGAAIDGSTLTALVAGATVAKVQELVTAYPSGSWSAIRPVQAETTDILLAGSVPPQALTVATLPTLSTSAIFAIGVAIFNDGPYLDPFTNGVQATPSAVSGSITLTLGFAAYSATQAYAKGSFVTSSSVNYISLIDNNVGNTPASSPSQWAVTSAGAAINTGQGFLGTDIGRLIRLFSEPLLWVATTGYTTGQIVAYNPSGQPGAATYWTALAATTGNIPGTDTTHWGLTPANAALWSWGKITSLSTQISQSLAGVANIGTMTQGGGLAGGFNGNAAQLAATSPQLSNTQAGTAVVTFTYIGQNFTTPGAQAIASATVYPTTDQGFLQGRLFFFNGEAVGSSLSVTFNLRASQTAPSNSSNGTLLGTTGLLEQPTNAVTINSSDQVTAWKFVWIEMVAQNFTLTGGVNTIQLICYIGQVFFYAPPGSGVSGNGVNIELLGPPLLYTTPVRTWRLGVYSNTTGFPTCGTYFDGRLYLGGAVANRFDACFANGILGGTVNFAPTDQFGVVSAANAISYTFNSDGTNPILWMKPDLQGVLMGTQAGEWLVQAPTAGSIAPNNISARNVTNHGSANIQPVSTEHTKVFVQRYAQKLLEYFPDVFSGKFSAPNLADKAQHLTRNSVAELAYTSAITPIIWLRDALGGLFGITYKRDSLTSAQPPSFYGWHRHTLGSGRIVESICTGPSVGGNLDSLTMVTNDPATGIRHVELLTDTMDEQSPLSSAWFLDDSVSPTSTTTTNAPTLPSAPYGGLTINGLWHLNGKTVQVWAGGLDCGDRGLGPISFTDFLVTNGSITVPYGDTISAGSGKGLFTAAYAAALTVPIVIGFTYTSQGQVVHPISPAETGARNGPAFGKKSRIHRYAAKVVNTLGISFGTKFTKLFPGKFQDSAGTTLPPLTTFSGILEDSLQDDYGYEHGMCWQITRPYPANIAAIGANLETMDQ